MAKPSGLAEDQVAPIGVMGSLKTEKEAKLDQIVKAGMDKPQYGGSLSVPPEVSLSRKKLATALLKKESIDLSTEVLVSVLLEVSPLRRKE
jgi:hypothetical protein